jgi:hypothetical protein
MKRNKAWPFTICMAGRRSKRRLHTMSGNCTYSLACSNIKPKNINTYIANNTGRGTDSIFNSSTADPNIRKRVYIHCKTPLDGLNVCETLSMMMAVTTFGIQQFKIAAPGGFKRLDSIVVYLAAGQDGKSPDHYVDKVCAFLTAPQRGLRNCFTNPLPAAVKQWHDEVGVGFADEPPRIGVLDDEDYDELQSFGGFLASLIYQALKETMQGEPNWNDFVKYVYAMANIAGIDPASPGQIGGVDFLTKVGKDLTSNVSSWTMRYQKKSKK